MKRSDLNPLALPTPDNLRMLAAKLRRQRAIGEEGEDFLRRVAAEMERLRRRHEFT